ncbi:MAG: hypothetical protein KDI36_07705 [Pseudomonadales bacterium]|nr:hypothetical protein [Pseudomonadales bacterium]
MENSSGASFPDRTQEPHADCWVPDVPGEGGDFSVRNLPFGDNRKKGAGIGYRGCVAIVDFLQKLAAVDAPGVIQDTEYSQSLQTVLSHNTGRSVFGVAFLKDWSARDIQAFGKLTGAIL